MKYPKQLKLLGRQGTKFDQGRETDRKEEREQLTQNYTKQAVNPVTIPRNCHI